jgi:hypothetical protein
MANTSARLRVVVWVASVSGVGVAAAGLYGIWGWPAAVLFVGACLMAFGTLTAVVAGAGGR